MHTTGGLTKDMRVGWTTFSTNVDTSSITLSNYTVDELVDYVENIYYSGGRTNTAGVLDAILAEYEANGKDGTLSIFKIGDQICRCLVLCCLPQIDRKW